MGSFCKEKDAVFIASCISTARWDHRQWHGRTSSSAFAYVHGSRRVSQYRPQGGLCAAETHSHFKCQKVSLSGPGRPNSNGIIAL